MKRYSKALARQLIIFVFYNDDKYYIGEIMKITRRLRYASGDFNKPQFLE